MKNLVHDIIAKQFLTNIKALGVILRKAQTHAENNKFDVNKFLDMKLAPDMFAFTKQVQMVTDNAKGACARLSGKENPVFADSEKTMEELLQRINNTVDFISQFKPNDFNQYEEKKISFPWYPGKHLTGNDYLISYALPNFYFHLTTVYAILRSNGVPVGKNDFLGEVNWQNN